jgi:hypothetical protein
VKTSFFVAGLAATAFACSSAPSSEAPEASEAAAQSESAALPVKSACDRVLQKALAQPIRPPAFVAGVDFSGKGGDGIDIGDAEYALCGGDESTPGKDDPDQDTSVFWGWDNGRVPLSADFDADTHLAKSWGVGTGYTGSVEFHSRVGGRFGAHTYSIKVGTPILRDGQPLVFDWAAPAADDDTATELADALVATFAPALPPIDDSCRKNARCLFFNDLTGQFGGAAFGARDVHFYFEVGSASHSLSDVSPPMDLYGLVQPAALTPPDYVPISNFF